MVASSPPSYRSGRSRADLMACARVLSRADFLARFNQHQQRLVGRCRHAWSRALTHNGAIDRVDLGWSATLHVLEHRRLGGSDIATVLAHSLRRVGVG